MAGYLAAADKVRETFHCLVLIVHHSGLEHGRPRGHTSLTGAADVQISIKLVSDTSVLAVEFLKDGEEGTQLYSKLEVVDVGYGKTSCVIVEADPPADDRRLSDRAEAMLKICERWAIAPGGVEQARPCCWHRDGPARRPSGRASGAYEQRQDRPASGR